MSIASRSDAKHLFITVNHTGKAISRQFPRTEIKLQTDNFIFNTKTLNVVILLFSGMIEPKNVETIF